MYGGDNERVIAIMQNECWYVKRDEWNCRTV